MNPADMPSQQRPPTTPVSDEPAARRTTRRLRVISRGAVRRLAWVVVILVFAAGASWWTMIRMPGASHSGPLPPITVEQTAAADRMKADIDALTSSIGQRSTYHARQLAESALWIKGRLESMGYAVVEHSYASRGAACPNMHVEIRGASPDPSLATEIVLVGAHFDSYQGTPGADDNASGVAMTLELARRFIGSSPTRTLRLTFFVNEEPPAFQTDDMGSLIYARKARADGDRIVAMLSLESVGYYRDEPGSQKYPPPLSSFYPDRGDFIAFVGNIASRALVRRAVGVFRETTPFPSEGASLPDGIPGIGWSDHWAFWQEGIPAIMVTGTAPFRNPHYHTPGDTPEIVDVGRMSRVADGVERVLRDLLEK
jgi:Zn-dependent M28 family amino/carboxypeptidase